MGRSRHTEAQIIAALKPVEAGSTADDVAPRVWHQPGNDLRMEGEVSCRIPSNRRSQFACGFKLSDAR